MERKMEMKKTETKMNERKGNKCLELVSVIHIHISIIYIYIYIYIYRTRERTGELIDGC